LVILEGPFVAPPGDQGRSSLPLPVLGKYAHLRTFTFHAVKRVESPRESSLSLEEGTLFVGAADRDSIRARICASASANPQVMIELRFARSLNRFCLIARSRSRSGRDESRLVAATRRFSALLLSVRVLSSRSSCANPRAVRRSAG